MIKIGDFQAGLIFSVLYFLIITPLGFVVNLFNDFLLIRGFPVWKDTNIKPNSVSGLREQS